MKEIALNTWSIAAVDRETGYMGVALASCVPDMHADAVAAFVPGKGLAVTQAYFTIENRDKVYEMLKVGKSAKEIIEVLSSPDYDPETGIRQYGVITIHDDGVDIETFSGKENTPWFGSRSDPSLAVTVQGNILVGQAVVGNAFKAFQKEGTLADKLIGALEAGSAAGGDSRCNNDDVTQTAATAFMIVVRRDDPPYATKEIGITDMETDNAPWLCLSVHDRQFGGNSVEQLKALYESWKIKGR